MLQDKKKRKVTIVGAGAVGSTYAYALAQSGFADEIVLTDLNGDLAKGQAMDLVQGVPYMPPVEIHAGSDEDFADSDLVVVTAGAKQAPGETRIALLRRNAGIIAGTMQRIAASGCSGVVLLVSNPVDILTKIALDASGWDRCRVFGSGTVLDTARFRHALSRDAKVDPRNVHGYILGEHGDSEFPAWSLTTVAGMSFGKFCEQAGICPEAGRNVRKAIEEEVRDSAYHIIDYKGSTYYAVGMALTRITGAILRNEGSILSVSVELQGEYGLEGVCLSVPCIVGRSGIRQVLDAPLPPEELELLRESGARLRKALEALRTPE